MKKVLYSLLTIGACASTGFSANAQSFTLEKDTVTVTAYGYVDIYNNITNSTNDTISISWKIIGHNLPTEWQNDAAFGLCDNVQCYDKSILSGTTQKTMPIDANDKTLFKVQIDVSASTVTPTNSGPLYVTAELTHNTTVDTATFQFFKWGTNISSTQTKSNVTIYPNPAKNNVRVTFDKQSNIKTIAIYSLVGKQLVKHNVTNAEYANIDISNIPSGIYFIRLIDDQGQVISTRRFTHQ